MILEKRQHELFNLVNDLFDPTKIECPIFIQEEHCSDSKILNEQNIFDVLGFFDCNFSDSIFLCIERILYFSKKKNLNPNIVAEIVAIHELAHYIHCKRIDYATYCENRGHDSKYYFECFAQLITHKICINQPDDYLKTFEIMKENQAEEYTFYHENNDRIGCPISALPKEVLFDVFLNVKLIPDSLDSLISLIEIKYLRWFELTIINSNNQELLNEFQAEKELFLLGLFKLHQIYNLLYKGKFIEFIKNK